jgi:FkbH-like protein
MTHTPRRVLLACTFTSEPIVAGACQAFVRQNYPARVEAAPYGHVVEALAQLAEPVPDIDAVLLVVRPADLVRTAAASYPAARDSGAHAADRGAFERADTWMDLLVMAIRGWTRRQAVPLVVGVVREAGQLAREPALAAVPGDWAEAAADRIAADASAAGAIVPDLERLAYDPFLDSLAHLPYPPPALEQVGASLARAAWIAMNPLVKAIVFDCDDTLWGGSCAELGVDGVDRSGPYARIQQAALRQRAAGRLLCLASHNDEADVVAAFTAIGPLRLDHFTVRRISWSAKSAMLANLADELGFGPDSLVFIDDNPVNRAEVRAALPMVWVPDFGSAAELADLMEQSWLFAATALSEEDRERARRYEQAGERDRQAQSAASLNDFLASLEVSVQASQLDAGSVARARQLIARTNQFAHVANGFSLDDREPPVESSRWVLAVEDRIGDYGKVGILAAHADGETLYVDALVLSCRVLGRGVEACLVSLLERDAEMLAAKRVHLELTRTPRNEPIQGFVREMSGGRVTETQDSIVLSLPVEELCAAPTHARLLVKENA